MANSALLCTLTITFTDIHIKHFCNILLFFCLLQSQPTNYANYCNNCKEYNNLY